MIRRFPAFGGLSRGGLRSAAAHQPGRRLWTRETRVYIKEGGAEPALCSVQARLLEQVVEGRTSIESGRRT